MRRPKQQAEPARRDILLCALGTTPQVVTETLYALTVTHGRPCPTEVHLVSSRDGADKAREMLLAPGTGQLAALCQEYGLALPLCDESTVHVVKRDGVPVTDLRTVEDNEAAADTIFELVRKLTADPLSRIHFSIAGGRKTMTYYLGYCASLLARPQDDMSHVLVDAPFENDRAFFFPHKPAALDNVLATPGAQPGPVHLANVPLLRLRGRLPPALLAEQRSFGTVVKILNALEQRSLTLRVSAPEKPGGRCRHRVSLSDELEIALSPKAFSFLWAMAAIKLRGIAEVNSENWKGLFLEHFMPVYQAVTGKSARAEQAYEKVTGRRRAKVEKATPLPHEELKKFRNEVDALNRELRERVGPDAHEIFGVRVDSAGDLRRYHLQAPVGGLRLEGEEHVRYVPGKHANSVFSFRP